MSAKKVNQHDEAENVAMEDAETEMMQEEASLIAAEDALAAELQEAQKKAEEHWDMLLRSRAEMENLRRRTQKDLENAHKFALEKFMLELLPVKDSMELGLATEQASVEALREGMALTLNMLQRAFEKFNVVEINPVREKFNPDLHQAMSMQPSAEFEPNTVIAVMQKGYTLNDRLVRPAMVMVSRSPD